MSLKVTESSYISFFSVQIMKNQLKYDCLNNAKAMNCVLALLVETTHNKIPPLKTNSSYTHTHIDLKK